MYSWALAKRQSGKLLQDGKHKLRLKGIGALARAIPKALGEQKEKELQWRYVFALSLSSLR